MRHKIATIILSVCILLCSASCISQADTPSKGIIPMVNGILIDNEWKAVDAASLEKFDYALIYFSAHWCPPCKTFTPKLIAFYQSNHNDKNFEIVYVSADRTESEMKDYFATMPWLAIKYSEIRKSGLINRYAGPGIPCLVMLDKNGRVVSDTFQGKSYVGPNKVLQDLKAAIQ